MTLVDQYTSQGYVILPPTHPFLPSSLSPRLLSASKDLIARTRTGEWPYKRTVGSQFPPYKENKDGDVWGVQHVMHPDALGPGTERNDQSGPFLEWYTSKGVRSVVSELLGEDEKGERLQMELFNILINPLKSDFALRWHRDDVKNSATEEEEKLLLAKPQYGVQWNTALLPDSCLYIVPGSHRTPRTAEQRTHSMNPDPPENPLDMPGSIQVHLKAGETVIYNQNLLHCASYSFSSPRITLHACMGTTGGGGGGGRERARNILQHGVGWLKDDERFKKMVERRGEEARRMWSNTVGCEGVNGAMMERNGEDLGYSQD